MGKLLKCVVLLVCLIVQELSVSLCEEQDFYEILGVDRSASLRDIRKAFKQIALEKHPDKNMVGRRPLCNGRFYK